jgi:Domain of unknown function (DUF397)
LTVEINAKGLRVDTQRAVWRKSSLSGPNCDNCVEVAFVDEAVLVRDSKDPSGPVFVFTHGEWKAFVGGVERGEFNL